MRPSPMQRILLILLLVALAVTTVFLMDHDAASENVAQPDQGQAYSELVHVPEGPAPAAPAIEDAWTDVEEAGITRESATAAASAEPSAETATLRIRVVDPFGSPLSGIPVALGLRDENDMHEVYRSSSDDDGLLEIRWEVTELAEEEVLLLGFPFPVLDGTPEWITDPSQWNEEVVEMVLPVYGSAEVHLFDVDGEPWMRPTLVKLAPTPEEGEGGQYPVSLDTVSNLGVRSEDGVAVFPIVGLFKNLHATNGRDDWAQWKLALGPGPSMDGEQVRLELHQYRRNPVIRVAVLDSVGMAVKDQDFDLKWHTHKANKLSLSGSSWTQSGFHSNADGILEFPINRGIYGDLVELGVTTAGTDPEQTLHGIAPMPLPIPLPWDETEEAVVITLDDLTLHPPALIGSGTIRTPEGKPAQADLDLKQVIRLKVNGFDKVSGQSVPAFRMETQEDGSFQIFGIRASEEMYLEVKPPTGIAQERSFTAGTKDLDFIIEPDFFIQGQIKIPEGVDPSELRVRFFPVGELLHANHNMDAPDGIPTEDGSFELRGLKDAQPGTVSVLHESSRSYLTGVSEIAPTQDASFRDPRLFPIDLAGYTRNTIRLEPPKWQSVHNAKLVILEPEMLPYQDEIYIHDQDIEIVSLHPVMKVRIDPYDFRSEFLTLSGGHYEVKMRKALELGIQIENVPELREGYALRFVTGPIEGDFRQQHRHTTPSSWRKGFQVPIKDVGRYRLQIMLEKVDDRRSVGMPPWIWDFEIPEEGKAEDVSITIEQSDLLDAYLKLDQPLQQHH